MTTRRRHLFSLFAAMQSPHDGTTSYIVKTAHQAYDTTVRIARPAKSTDRLLLVLPVNPDISHRWGDGFDTIVQARLHHRYGFALAAPSFTAWPWYADHPTNPKIRQESYLLNDVLPLLDKLFPNHRRLLVGFSKSGNGALQLLLRHPERFTAAAAWDAPLMKRAPDQFFMGDVFATQENFEQYAIPTLCEQKSDLFRDKPARIALLGYDNFAQHMTEAHELMERQAIPHRYDNATKRPHRWDSGWLEGALAMLDEMAMTAK